MPELLKFPVGKGHINIPQRIGTNFTEFGIFLLNDPTGARVEAIEKELRGEAKKINVQILREWLKGDGLQPVTWQTLVDVVGDCGLSILAGDIKAVKC